MIVPLDKDTLWEFVMDDCACTTEQALSAAAITAKVSVVRSKFCDCVRTHGSDAVKLCWDIIGQ
jgi:hypothetical protein